MNFSKIAEERKKLNLSQAELAEKLGVSQKSISKYECGTRRPSYEILVAMSKLFDVSTDYLLDIEDLLPKEQGCANEDEQTLILSYNEFQEKKYIDSYRQLNDANKDIIIGEIQKLLKEQRSEVVADTSQYGKAVGK